MKLLLAMPVNPPLTRMRPLSSSRTWWEKRGTVPGIGVGRGVGVAVGVETGACGVGGGAGVAVGVAVGAGRVGDGAGIAVGVDVGASDVGDGTGVKVGVCGGGCVGVGVIVGDGAASHAASKATAITEASPTARIPRGALRKRARAPERVILVPFSSQP